ncbi:nucleotidyltransferase substrate binding protein [Blastomonas sp.]|uniref:nucleotidyltransferase substrate binding protein n=1 Tax=Blastomonas sp. TaxID=1909299 RepID=UPI00391C3417
MSSDEVGPAPTPADRPRWEYRFDNFHRAYLLLREAIEFSRERGLSQLEQEGTVQRFEYCWELAWKTIKDYLEFQGVVLDTVTPRAVLKAAFAANLIEDGEVWMTALNARNKMSHTYNLKMFEQVVKAIEARYLGLMGQLDETLLAVRAQGDG